MIKKGLPLCSVCKCCQHVVVKFGTMASDCRNTGCNILCSSSYEWCINFTSRQQKNMTAILLDIADADISDYSESQLKDLVVGCPDESEVSG